jgi:hypothetical protein
MQTNLESIQASKPEGRKGPVWETRIGGFSVSIWENRREIGDRTVLVRNVTLTKRFRDKSGELRSSATYLMENELPQVITALHQALNRLDYGDSERQKEVAS